ncbi:hypothetical protein ACEK07_03315 [Alcanivoracaceae bacterium MT1]
MNTFYTYKDYRYYVVFEDSYHYVVICNGYEICSATSCRSVKMKFEALVDTGLVIKKPRIIGD